MIPTRFFLLLALAGCASVPKPPSLEGVLDALPAVAALPAPEFLPPEAPEAPAERAWPDAAEPGDEVAPPAKAIAKVPAPSAKAPARPAAAAPEIAPSTDAPAPIPAPAPVLPPRDAEPLLDVAALKSRLRETKAIGTLAKLSLRNQMDDLVDQFRAHHLAAIAGGVAAMRPPYDALVFKVLVAVQQGDPALARTISDSREALWEILADPLKFASIT